MRPLIPLVGATLALSPLHAETLADAVSQAYRDNPTIQAARYDLRATDETIVQANSELRPQASVEIDGTYEYLKRGRASLADDPFLNSRISQKQGQATLTLTQPIYTGGHAAADIAMAQADIQSDRQALRRGEGDILLQVITAYLDVRRYQASVEVWEESVAELDRLEKEIEARRKAGQLTLTDVAQAQGQLDVARGQLTLTQQNLENARADYVALVGHMPGELAEAPPLPLLPTRVETAFDLALRQSPELSQAIYTEMSSRANIDATRATGRATLALRGTAGIDGPISPYRLRDQDKSLVGQLVLTVPITAGGRISSQVREATDRNMSDRLQIEATRRALVRAVTNAWNAAAAAQRIFDILTEQQQTATIQLDGMIREYRVGLRSTFDVLYAQQLLRDVQVSLLGAARDRYVAQATLLRQVGQLEAQTILDGVPLYDPAAHLASIRNDHALPWDAGFKAIDAILGRDSGTRPIQHPGAPVSPPGIKAAPQVPTPTDYVKAVPSTPLPNTTAIPAPGSTP